MTVVTPYLVQVQPWWWYVADHCFGVIQITARQDLLYKARDASLPDRENGQSHGI